MKKHYLAACLAWAAVAALPAAQAQQKTFTLAGYGGSFEKTMREQVLPPFAAKHNLRVEYVAGNSTDTLAKMQAQKGNQQIDVAPFLQDLERVRDAGDTEPHATLRRRFDFLLRQRV